MECKAELRAIIYQMIAHITELAPAVHVVDEEFTYECERANLAVYPPLSWTEDQCDELQLKIGERISDVNVETGYLILVGVRSPIEQVAEVQRELAATKKRIKILEERLSEAEALGLGRATQIEAELVPA